MLSFLRFLFLCCVAASSALGQAPVRDGHVEAALLAESTAVVPGQVLHVGLRLTHDQGWHSYWLSSATGYATSLQWDLPDGFEAKPIQWPAPVPYQVGDFVDFVYEDTILLPVDIQVPADFNGTSVTLRATAEWLMCEAICIPGSAALSLTLPVAKSAAPNPSTAPLFAKTRMNLPVEAAPLTLTAVAVNATTLRLQIDGPALPQSVHFFDAPAILEPALSQPLTRPNPNRIEVTLALDALQERMPARLVGTLAAPEGWPTHDGRTALAVDIPINPPESAPATEPQLSIGILFFAFLGGLILNLMPCVFPVIGIKVMGFVQQAGEHPSRVILHGLTFTLGVLLSFWLLVAVLIGLRATGTELGWGFQLQSPAFVFVLAVFLLVFALNMSGVFEIGQSAMGVGSNLTAQSGLSGSFFSGVLATVVATPCAAPFLGYVLGVAFALPPLSAFTVFTAIALGLSTPYLLLSAFPRLLRALPRPGPWMESFKQGMAFLIYGTVAFLLWILLGQLTEDSGFTPFASLAVLFALVLTATAAWIYGRFAPFHASKRSRIIGTFSAFACLAAAVFTGFPRSSPPLDWQTWEPGLAERLSAQGQHVYVDFTARWCVTCQTNKAAVFASSKVRDFIRQNDVALLKADWTNHDPTIGRALAAFNRSAVPFNLVYLPNSPAPVILPELLTPGIVLDALNASPAAP